MGTNILNSRVIMLFIMLDQKCLICPRILTLFEKKISVDEVKELFRNVQFFIE